MPRRPLRKLFRRSQPVDQVDSTGIPEEPADLPEGWQLGGDVGFTGDAASIRVSKGYHRSPTWGEPEPRLHLAATVGYFNMVAKRSYDEAEERGDGEVLALLESAHKAAANAVLMALDRLRSEVEARDYDVESRPHRWNGSTRAAGDHEVLREAS